MRNKCVIRAAPLGWLSTPQKEAKKEAVRKTKRSYKLGVTKLGKMQRPWGKCNESAIWYSTHTTLTPTTGTCLEYNLLQLEFCGVSRESPACSLYLATGTSHSCCLLDTRDILPIMTITRRRVFDETIPFSAG